MNRNWNRRKTDPKVVLPNLENVMAQLKKDEGFSPIAYFDTDQWTYGYGTQAPHEGSTIIEPLAEAELRDRVTVSIQEFTTLFGSVRGMDQVRAEAIVNMLFNLGLTKFSRFSRLITAIYSEDWGHAAYEAFDSLWYRQLRKRGIEKSVERSERIVWEILTGEK